MDNIGLNISSIGMNSGRVENKNSINNAMEMVNSDNRQVLVIDNSNFDDSSYIKPDDLLM